MRLLRSAERMTVQDGIVVLWGSLHAGFRSECEIAVDVSLAGDGG